jgi:hypothetical protein
MSFHVVRHEHPTIFVVNRQTYETYRFTIGDDVALARVGPGSGLADERRTAIAFLAQREREVEEGRGRSSVTRAIVNSAQAAFASDQH